MELLLAGLRKVQTSPPPARKPKAPAAPRLLHKLIEVIRPDEESPLREKLRQKLEAINDLNQSLAGTFFMSPLNLVVEKGFLPEAKRLIERGAEINPELKRPDLMCPPLVQACAAGKLEIVELLLNAGATIYAKHDSIRQSGKYSRALSYAADSGEV